jgi:hypothetical protein
MRVMLKANVPTPAGNAAIEAGTMGPTMAKVIEALKPEAVYFSLDNGMRTGFFFFDLKDPTDMPKAAEDLFIKLGAQITMTPAMTFEELGKGLAKLG